MDEEKLTDEKLEEISCGKGLSESLDYALEQGKKVLTIVTDTLKKLTAGE